MKKVIEFTEAQKSLIANEFVKPANGTSNDALRFVEYCEELGLNPILNDVVFQKFETKNGPRASFVTTRDGLLRVAARDENYMGAPVSSVVREGDHFEFLPSKGDVVHQFGNKRGKILGAYAVLHHKKFGPAAQWVEFGEYFMANAHSQGGKSYIWDKYPSAMIQKVAEAFVLKRQFPLVGGLTTEEETGMEVNLPEQIKNLPVEKPATDTASSTEPQAKETRETINVAENNKPEAEENTQAQPKVEAEKPSYPNSVETQPKEEKKETVKDSRPAQENKKQETPEQQPSSTLEGYEMFKVLDIKFGESNSHIKYANVQLQGTEGKFTALARNNSLEKAQGLTVDSSVLMKINNFNSWHMIEDIQEATQHA